MASFSDLFYLFLMLLLQLMNMAQIIGVQLIVKHVFRTLESLQKLLSSRWDTTKMLFNIKADWLRLFQWKHLRRYSMQFIQLT